MYFSKIIKYILLLFLFLIIISNIFIENIAFPVNNLTFLLIYFYVSILFYFNKIGVKKNKQILLLLNIVNILTFLQQIVFLLYFDNPNSLVNFIHHTPNINKVNFALFFLVVCNIILGLTLILNFKTFSLPVSINKKTLSVFTHYNSWIKYVILSLILGMFLFFNYSVGASGSKASGFAWLSKIFSEYLILLFLSFFILSSSINFTKANKKLLYSILVFYVLLTIFQGSRGGIVSFLIIILLFSIFKYGDFYIKSSRINFIVLIVAFSLVIITPLATVIRELNVSKTIVTSAALSIDLKRDTFNKAMFFVQWPSARFGRFDQLVVLCSEPIPNVNKEVPLSNILKSTYNSLSVGGEFTDLLKLGKAYPVLYNNFPIDRIHGAEWSLFGVSYFYFNFIGSIFFLIIYGLVVRYLYKKMTHIDQNSYDFIIYFTVFYYLFYSLFTNGLLDSFISDIILNIILIYFFRLLFSLRIR